MTRMSSYTQGKTVDEVADDWKAEILHDAASTDIDDGAITTEWGYGVEMFTAVQVTLAGGGPGADITFLFGEDEDDPREAFFNYYENGAVSRYFNEWEATKVWNAMQRDPSELVDDDDSGDSDDDD